jgi:hypothetical protein
VADCLLAQTFVDTFTLHGQSDKPWSSHVYLIDMPVSIVKQHKGVWQVWQFYSERRHDNQELTI